MIIESERLLAEDLERLEQAIADRLLEEPKAVSNLLIIQTPPPRPLLPHCTLVDESHFSEEVELMPGCFIPRSANASHEIIKSPALSTVSRTKASDFLRSSEMQKVLGQKKSNPSPAANPLRNSTASWPAQRTFIDDTPMSLWRTWNARTNAAQWRVQLVL